MPVLTTDDVLEAQAVVGGVRMDESLLDYIMSIVEATRRSEFLLIGRAARADRWLCAARRRRWHITRDAITASRTTSSGWRSRSWPTG